MLPFWPTSVSREFKLFFPRELVSFVRSRELVSIDQRHLTRSPALGKIFKLGGVTMQARHLETYPTP